VIGSFQRGGFRSSVAYWVGDGELTLVESLGQLDDLLATWSGIYPDPADWLKAEREARTEAEKNVQEMEQQALRRERLGLEAQVSAARLRLQRELGRYLVCLRAGTEDLNGLLDRQLSRDIATAQRLKRCLDRLGGYPEWTQGMCRDLEAFVRELAENQIRARLLGNEIDAALEDPRWLAQ